ncbi:GIY-YIG nuclease family protein [Candidatus Saccharibacteria bacterium]|nr:GIY-YIG nuclease family protein [Candidatus Saccharibacteria bacterium]
MNNDTEHLTILHNRLTEAWVSSLKVGDTVNNYSLKWKNKEIINKTLRVGVIKEIHNNRLSHYVIVDNLTTGRQNKWNDYDLVKPQEIQDVEERLHQELSNYEDSQVRVEAEIPKTINAVKAQAEYKQLIESANKILLNDNIQAGKCVGVYGAFNKNSGECIYIGKSKKMISERWREHARHWKKFRPIHIQTLLTQYFYFFKDQIEWRVLLPIEGNVDNDLIEYCERRLFEQYRPIANSIIPNGTYYGRSVLENEGDSISVSVWNPYMVTIKIHKGNYNGFSDNKIRF